MQQRLALQETLFSPTPSGLVLGTKLGTVELTPGGAERPPVFEKLRTCVARECAQSRAHREPRRRAAS